jgi:hypothetical protein
MNDELIDFPVSNAYRDSYHQQGLTRLPSAEWYNRRAPAIRPNGHVIDECVCAECWWGIETGSQSGKLFSDQIAKLWRAVDGLRKRPTSTKAIPVRRRINE